MTCPNETEILTLAESDADPAGAHCAECSATIVELRGTIDLLRRAAGVQHVPARPSRWIPLASAAAAVLVTVLALMRGPAQAPAAPATPQDGGSKSQADVQALVDRLGDESLEERHRAFTELARLGKGAVPQLEKGLKHASAEVRSRCRVLLDRVRRSAEWAAFVHAGSRAAARGRLPESAAGSLSRGLDWLTRSQSEDGSWDNRTGVTALAVLAYMAAGEGETSRSHGRAIARGLAWLRRVQDVDGCVGPRSDSKYMYGHAIATWALVEAHAGSYALDDHRVPAERAVKFLVDARNADFAWRYSHRAGDNDTSVTFWCASALAVAKACGFEVPESAHAGAKAWLQQVTQPATGRVGYNALGTGKVFIAGLNGDFNHHETLAAASIALRRLAREEADELMAAQAALLGVDRPSVVANDRDFYYWHIGALALYQLEGHEGATWAPWRTALFDAIVGLQDAGGSWDNDRWSRDPEAGSAYATAVNVLSLTAEFRYPRP